MAKPINPAAGPTDPDEASERTDGPPVVVFRGADEPGNPFRLGTREYDWHSHRRGLFFCIESGLIHVRTEQGSWLLPPNRAGWIPPDVPHKVSVAGVLSGWSVLVAPQAAANLAPAPCVVATGELLTALVRRVADWGWRPRLDAPEARIAAVLLDEIARAPREALHLPMPADRRLARIAVALAAAPDDNRPLDGWARWAGLSPRTARRLFAGETGLSFGRWRQQARLVLALERLARGEAVAEVADALGYASPSGFIAMFRRCFGAPPGRYFAAGSVALFEPPDPAQAGKHPGP